MLSMNEITIAGFVGGDAKTSDKVSSFTICHSYKTKEGQTVSNWFRVVGFRDYLMNIMSEVKKGDNVWVRGQCQPKEYTDKNGNPQKSIDIVADKIAIIKRTNKQHQNSGGDDIGGFS